MILPILTVAGIRRAKSRWCIRQRNGFAYTLDFGPRAGGLAHRRRVRAVTNWGEGRWILTHRRRWLDYGETDPAHFPGAIEGACSQSRRAGR